MKIILCAIDKPLLYAFQSHCGDLPNVTVFEGSVFDCGAQFVVTPGNSFGFMDGGLDLEVATRWPHAATKIRKIAMAGEILVGQALQCLLLDDPFFSVVYAPTMRVPMRLPSDTVNPYLATRGALRSSAYDVQFSMAFPGMGTGVGQVGPVRCAKQMGQAIRDNGILGFSGPKSFLEAQQRHQKLIDG